MEELYCFVIITTTTIIIPKPNTTKAYNNNNNNTRTKRYEGITKEMTISSGSHSSSD